MRENLPDPDIMGIYYKQSTIDFMGSGAWPFIVGGLLCQVDSGNERDLLLLIRFC